MKDFEPTKVVDVAPSLPSLRPANPLSCSTCKKPIHPGFGQCVNCGAENIGYGGLWVVEKLKDGVWEFASAWASDGVPAAMVKNRETLLDGCRFRVVKFERACEVEFLQLKRREGP